MTAGSSARRSCSCEATPLARRAGAAAVNPGDSPLIDLVCIDDDAQGKLLSVLWRVEPDARVLDEDVWAAVGAKGFNSPVARLTVDGRISAAELRPPSL
jgi:hypothetical protein